MREELRDPGRLEHILMAIDNVLSFTTDRSVEDLRDDKMLFYGTVKNLEIIGEAAYMLTPAFKNAHPGTPWKKIIGLRHILVHDYYQVEANELWNIIHKDLNPLKTQVTKYLKEIFGE